MANKISYTNLKLKVNEDVSTFDFEGQTVEVKKYLPIEDKYDLIMITLQKAEEDGIYNPLKVDIFFHLHLVYMYTNLSFTDKQKENELRIYDNLKSNGFIDKLVEVINNDEYNFLFNYMEETIEDIMKYKNTAGAVLQSVINDLPKNAEIAKNIVESFDQSKYQQVVDFAAAANGNRVIGQN